MSDFNGLSEPLSAREIEILTYLAEGLTIHENSGQLQLNTTVIKWCQSQLYSKFRARNHRELIERATALGLLNSDSDQS